MTNRLFVGGILLLLLLASPAPASAAEFVIENVDASEHPEVSLTVTLENQLFNEDTPEFLLTENGSERPVQVESTVSADLKVVLLVDGSGSMRGAPLIAAKDATARFIDQMPTGVEMAIISFGNAPSLAAEFTSDKQTLLNAVDLLAARGETALYDGLEAAAALLAGETESGRTIVLVSDGGDTVSTTSLEESQATLETLNAAFYAIELQSPENDREALDTLALAAGGTVASADEPASLDVVFGDVAAQLLSSYRLTYQSDSFDSATIEVKVLAGGAMVAESSRRIRLPADPTAVVPDPDPQPAPVTKPLPVPSAITPELDLTLRPGTPITLSWLETGTAAALGFTALFLALATAFSILWLRPRTPKKSRSTLTMTPKAKARAKRSPLTIVAESASELAERSLQRGDRFKTINAQLERAGMALRPGEFIVLVACALIGAAALGYLLVGLWLALLLPLIVVMVIPLRVSSKASQRSALFGEQLGDTLQLMSASMRAGYGLLQAVDAVAEEAPSPTAEEFHRIKIETHLGRDLDEGLKAAADRVDSEDFRWVAEAIEIHRQIGGDLAEILDAVNETIRDRNRIRRRIKALSAEGRISAIILSIIPLALTLVISIINPAYIGELVETGLGQVLIVFGVVAWLFAIGWMRKIIQMDF